MSNIHLSIDIGTSSIKAVLVNENGFILKKRVNKLPIIFNGGAAEHDLEALLNILRECLTSIVKGFEKSIESIAFDSYMHALAVLANDFRVTQNPMLHLDTRSSPSQASIKDWSKQLYDRTGCPPLFIYPIVKVIWLKQQKKLKDVSKFSFVKDYLLNKLFGHWCLDYGVASGTGLFNVHDLKWDDLALEIAGISESMLPDLVEGSKILDYVSLKEFGVEGKVALIPGTFDGAAQNIGLSAYDLRGALNLGSTLVVRLLKKQLTMDHDPRMRFFAYYAADGYFAIGGASNNGMTALEWIRSNVLGDRDWKEIDSEAGDIKPGSEGVMVFPFVAGERFPFRDPKLRLEIMRLALWNNWRHIARASFEGVSYIAKTMVKALRENDLYINELHVSGGGSSIDTLTKILSSVLDIPLIIYSREISRFSSALGAAAIALRALKYVNDLSKVTFESVSKSVNKIIYPSPEDKRIYEKYFESFAKTLETLRRQMNSP